MNAKQRNQNRSTAEALHYAIQQPKPKFGKTLLKPFHKPQAKK
jgi:hypothetical protein